MNREIKFRAKNLITNEWVYGTGYYTMPEMALRNGQWEDRNILVINRHGECGPQTIHESIDINTLGQYTGLKDKKGNEIYEGDIVLHYNDLTEMSKRMIKEVIFQWGSFGIEGVFKGSLITFSDILSRHVEVIGNVYENPELLERSNKDE